MSEKLIASEDMDEVITSQRGKILQIFWYSVDNINLLDTSFMYINYEGHICDVHSSLIAVTVDSYQANFSKN